MEQQDIRQWFSFDITPYARPRVYESGQTMVTQGQTIHKMLFVAQGRVKCWMGHENGVVSVLDFYQAPCFLGDMELLGALPDTSAVSGVTAVTRCSGWEIDLAGCQEEIRKDALFLRKLYELLCRKVIRNGCHGAYNQSYPLKNRLATFLLENRDEDIYRIPHTEAAPYLGVSYRHLLYVLAQFVQEGLVEKTAGGYRLLAPERLAEMALEHW